MLNNSPAILALDFDGVICDGMIEYFQTTKQTYLQVWNEGDNPSYLQKLEEKLDKLAPVFSRLRPVIESGWEMPILLRAIVLGISEEEIFQHWPTIALKIIETENIDKNELTKKLDRTRDNWIKNDLEGWLSLHRFYPGMIDKIQQILNSSTKFYIITTKGSRFVKQILLQQGIELPDGLIFGKEYKRPKYETLREILTINSINPAALWFIEDRLEALELVTQQPDLQEVKLFLATWGYNTQKIRDSIRDRQDIKLLTLEQFHQKIDSLGV
jgi:phosphoglycolate phosphatase-like HAD superfamily hydrolase